MMCNTKKVIVLAFWLLVAFTSSYSEWLAHGQMTSMKAAASNNTNLEYITNQNVFPDTSQDKPRIMENTTGMIDEALNALKDTFKSLFGK